MVVKDLSFYLTFFYLSIDMCGDGQSFIQRLSQRYVIYVCYAVVLVTVSFILQCCHLPGEFLHWL